MRLTRPKILLVDDTPLFLEVEKEYLRELAVIVYTAATGREAIDLLQVVRPDLIYLDLHMTGMDGAACCAAIKADNDLRALPVIIVSVTADETDLDRCRAAGCDGILTKPVSRQAFLEYGHRFLPEIEQIELRVPCQTQVIFKVGTRRFYAMSLDLSSRGLYIAFNGSVELEDRVTLNFLLPGGGLELIEAVARVAWINSGSRLLKPHLPAGFGVEFVWLSVHSEQRISQFMEQAEKNGACMMIENAYFMTEKSLND